MATTLNPSDKAANLTLSNGNKSWVAAAAANNSARSVHTLSGKQYWEFTVSGAASPEEVFCGISTASESLTNKMGYGSYPADSLAISNTAVMALGGFTQFFITIADGDTICIAVDVPNTKFWARVNNGAWSQSGDPATNTGGYSYSGEPMASASLYIGVTANTTTNTGTLKTAPADWLYSAPSGFSEVGPAAGAGRIARRARPVRFYKRRF